MKRKSGVLLHPSSLPGPNGIGEIGSGCKVFLDFLSDAGQSLWQILPLGPVGYGNSPYSAVSSFAGNPLLICLDDLASNGYISESDYPNSKLTVPSTDWIDFETLSSWKESVLKKAAFKFAGLKQSQAVLEDFCTAHPWVEDFAVFMAARKHFDAKAEKEAAGNSQWNRYWPEELAVRDADSLIKWTRKLKKEIECQKILQYFFFSQWNETKTMAAERGISIIGDIPIFVAENSADVWVNREIFLLDKNAKPEVVAGVPPDYFSETGQRWGNPLYNWKALKKTGYDWWLQRISTLLEMVDIIRIDHFKGFESYWEIPAEEKTAINGRWVKGPGDMFFNTVFEKFPGVEILAEDLGLITPEVHALRDRHHLPGMNVLQFAFELNDEGAFNAENAFLPHNHRQRSVVYTGTHDNDTTKGWYSALSSEKKDLVRRYFNRDDAEIVWEMLRAAQMSVAEYAIAPLQDFLNLPSDARMNTPGTVGRHNWCWRVRKEALNSAVSDRIRNLSMLSGRLAADSIG